MVTLCTIGFAGKSLERFLELLERAEVQRLIDVRLRPSSQLSGYARQADLRYVLERFVGIEYVHAPVLTPTAAVLDGVRASKDWSAYEAGFAVLMAERDMPAHLGTFVAGAQRVALLCSEDKATHCHRRLLAEAYAARHPDTTVVHLG